MSVKDEREAIERVLEKFPEGYVERVGEEIIAYIFPPDFYDVFQDHPAVVFSQEFDGLVTIEGVEYLCRENEDLGIPLYVVDWLLEGI